MHCFVVVVVVVVVVDRILSSFEFAFNDDCRTMFDSNASNASNASHFSSPSHTHTSSPSRTHSSKKSKRKKPVLVDRLKISLRSALEKIAVREARLRQMTNKNNELAVEHETLKCNVEKLVKEMESREVVRNLMEEEYLQQIVTLQEEEEKRKRIIHFQKSQNGDGSIGDIDDGNIERTVTIKAAKDMERTVEEAILMSMALKQINAKKLLSDSKVK